jgi:hypothetical protein
MRGTWDTTSQLVRSVFQSTMGSYEGAFSAEPAAGDHLRGGWGGTGSRWLGPRPTRSCQTWLCSENESPARRSAGGCQVVGAGARLPELGRKWAQTEARRRGAAASPGYLLSPIISGVRELQQALQRQSNPIAVLPPLPGSLGRQIGCWCTS